MKFNTNWIIYSHPVYYYFWFKYGWTIQNFTTKKIGSFKVNKVFSMYKTEKYDLIAMYDPFKNRMLISVFYVP